MPSRLIVRIYLVAVVQFVLVALAVETMHAVERRRLTPMGTKQAGYVAEQLARVYDDAASLRAEAEVAARRFDWTIDIRDRSGELLVHAEPATTELQTVWAKGTATIPLRDGGTASLHYQVHPPGPPPAAMRRSVMIPLILLITGVASFLTARSLATPLGRLSKVARAFGEGKLDVRAKIRRNDEIGEVAAAFDVMADRVERLLLAERELLANVSHELRTPLARVRVALEIANESDPQTALESLKDIAVDLGELERLVEDVLAMARLTHDSGGPSSAPTSLRARTEALDVRELLERSAARFGSLYPGAPLLVDVPEALPVIDGDPVLVRRAVDNLLDNARKYGATDARNPIELRARTQGDDVVIEVRDHGIGIAEGDLARVFEPFFRADRSRTRGTGGVGLGLALVKRVVEAHRGTITLDSKLGNGTTARIKLPLPRVDDSSALHA